MALTQAELVLLREWTVTEWQGLLEVRLPGMDRYLTGPEQMLLAHYKASMRLAGRQGHLTTAAQSADLVGAVTRDFESINDR